MYKRQENITQNSYAKLSPYIVGTSGNSIDNFIVITRERGIPIPLVRSLGLRISEVLEKSKELNLTIEEAEEIKKQGWVDSLVQKNQNVKTPNTNFFPNKIPFDWNQDNFGPIEIPASGQTIAINLSNLPLYKKIIVDYENNSLKTIGNEIFINDKKVNQYTFSQDYFCLLYTSPSPRD